MNRAQNGISVVLPAFNRQDSLEASISSVLGQSHSPLELIVVDDGSTDDSPQRLRRIDDPRLRVVTLGHNMGACAARNRGIRESRGAWIAFQDSDDIWHRDKLEKQWELMRDAPEAVGVVYSGFWHVHGAERSYRPSGAVRGHDGGVHAALLRGSFVALPTAVVRRTCFAAVGDFDEALPRFQDWELFLRISRQFEFRYLEEALIDAHYTEGSLSRSDEARIEAIGRIIEKHVTDFAADRRLWSHYQFLLGTWRCKAGQLREGRRNLSAALRADPTRVRNSTALLASLLGSRAYRWFAARRETGLEA